MKHAVQRAAADIESGDACGSAYYDAVDEVLTHEFADIVVNVHVDPEGTGSRENRCVTTKPR